MKQFFNELWEDLTNPFKDTWFYYKKRREVRRDKRALNKAIKWANERCLHERRRMYVMKDFEGHYRPLNRHEINGLKKQGVYSKDLQIDSLAEHAPYHIDYNTLINRKKK